MGLASTHRPIEPLDMSDLDDSIFVGGQTDEIISLGRRGRHWLFDEEMAIVLERGSGNFVMSARRDHDAHRLDFGQQALEIRERPCIMFGGYRTSPLLVDIIYPHEPGFRYVRQQPSVMKAEAPYPEYTYSNWIHWLVRPRLRARSSR